jgi:hypothetical protein
MGITQIQEPRVDSVSLEDWHKFLRRTTFQGGGYTCIDVGGINDGTKPTLKQGSRFELNGGFFVVSLEDYAISGTPATNTKDNNNYIYAAAGSNGTVTLEFSTDNPTWNGVKGGWYHGDNRRALVKFFYVGGSYNGKVILDSYNAMFMVNTKQDFSSTTSGGVQVFSRGSNGTSAANIPGDHTENLVPGIYRYELKGGDSGEPGKGGNQSLQQVNMALVGADGAAKNLATAIAGVFLWHGGPIKVKVGANGGDGGNGGAGAKNNVGNLAKRGGPGGGGGGGLDTILGSIIAPGASPTLGGDNSDNYGSTKKASAGSVGMGGCGGNGEDNKGDDEQVTWLGGQGLPGKISSDKTTGYARLWRLG